MALIPRKRMSSDLLDPEPREGSFNGVTSDGVFKGTGKAIDNILDDGSASETVVVAVPSSQSSNYTVGNYYEVQGKVARLRTKTDGDNVTQLTFDTTSGLLDAMNDIVESGVKYVDRYTSYSDVAATISRGQLPIMTIISGGTAYYYFPFYNGSGRIEFRSIQDGSIDCFTWNGTTWVAGDSVIYGMGSDTKSEVDIDQGVLSIDGGNVVTKVTLATVNAVTFSVNESVPAFAIEIDNTGNSNDVDVTVVNGAATLKYSSAAGNQVGAGKYMQLTCVGGCWTLAEFEAPTP